MTIDVLKCIALRSFLDKFLPEMSTQTLVSDLTHALPAPTIARPASSAVAAAGLVNGTGVSTTDSSGAAAPKAKRKYTRKPKVVAVPGVAIGGSDGSQDAAPAAAAGVIEDFARLAVTDPTTELAPSPHELAPAVVPPLSFTAAGHPLPPQSSAGTHGPVEDDMWEVVEGKRRPKLRAPTASIPAAAASASIDSVSRPAVQFISDEVVSLIDDCIRTQETLWISYEAIENRVSALVRSAA